MVFCFGIRRAVGATVLLSWTPLLSLDTVISGTSLRAKEPIAEASRELPPQPTPLLSNSRNLLAMDPSAFVQFLKTARPEPVSAENKARALISLPEEGEVTNRTDIIVGAGPTAGADREAVSAAVAMLPNAPARIAITDVMENRPEVRESLLKLDAFTVPGNAVIYLVQQSVVLKGARDRGKLFQAVLATILWHEMAHLRGADENGARKAEEELWTRFVRDGICDQVTALRYLQGLRTRPDDTALPRR